MKNFGYLRAPDVETALQAIGTEPEARFLGGGTNLVDLMRAGVEQPGTLVDITDLPLTEIDDLPDGGVRVGALVRNSHLAAHPLIRARYPMLAQAILSGASGQLRNMATVGGNLMQRTRCAYFYDGTTRCNKREPGAGCDAIGGFTREHAILGVGDDCIAVHPSDMGVALTALDAVVEARSTRGTRRIPLADFYPGTAPHVETALAADELITAVELPPAPVAANSRYRKVRDRASYAFALVAVAAAVHLDGDRISEVRLALGGVATRPWRAHAAERSLLGAPPTEDAFQEAARAELAAAVTTPANAFKVELAVRTVTATLRDLTTVREAA